MVDDWVSSCLTRWPPFRSCESFVVLMVGVVVGASDVRPPGGFLFFRKCLEMIIGGRKCVDAPSVERRGKQHASVVGGGPASFDGKFRSMSSLYRVAELCC